MSNKTSLKTSFVSAVICIFVSLCFVQSASAGASPTSSDISFALELIGSTEEIVAEMRKGPYLIYPGNPTQMTVLWQLDSTRTCRLEWGLDTSYSVGSVLTTQYGTDHQHKYTIGTSTPLTPGTKYFYRVEVEVGSGDYYTGTFLTAPGADAEDVKFLAYGDTRTDQASHNNVCAGIVSTYTGDPNYQTFLVHVGDWVANGDSESSWATEFFSRSPLYPSIKQLQANLPLQGCMGNHEISGNGFKKYWPYPYVADRYWSFDYGPVHVVIVDQYVDYRSWLAQLTWVEDDLSASMKDWKIIVLHEPGWSAGGHGNNIQVQDYIQPLCERYGVDIIFCGHNHYYARAEVNGVQHITTGGGGAPLYTPNPSYPNVVAAAKTYEFCKIDIRGHELTLEAVKPDGTIIDRFVLVLPEPPVANAGEDQTVYAWIDGIAEVTLDGSGSYDDDNNSLTYAWSWTVDGNEYEANGVSPIIELPIGEHTIQLVVNDGIDDSEADEVVITVTESMESRLWIFPQVINRHSRMKRIVAWVRLPEGVTKDQVDSNEPLVLYPQGEPDGIEATGQYVFQRGRRGRQRTSIFALFDKAELMEAVSDNGRVELEVVGCLNTGQYFYGSDTVWIKGRRWRRWRY